uniref:C-type lectin domain-containing protein n=1 Tax=Caenorhabditis tropicalis TaxID=1561998 RepID=A0A1I7URY2_9PELO
MQFLTILLSSLLLISMVSAQWNNNYWWYNPQPTQAPAFNWFGQGSQSDDKGNMWHGSDNAKLMLFAKSSWP